MIRNANHSRSREPALSEAEGDLLFAGGSIAAQEKPRRTNRRARSSIAARDERFPCVKLNSRGRVAQLVEQCPFKAWVAGSSPAALTILYPGIIVNVPFPPHPPLAPETVQVPVI
jgi:hypothetical protein